VPQHGNRGFSGTGRGGTIGGHLPPHQQNSQQGGLAGIGSPFGFGDQNSQPSGAPLSQTGMMTQVCKLEDYRVATSIVQTVNYLVMYNV
jgi:regulator of nonsense transcripts 1